ncbi:MAG: hypothetical protein IRY83_06010 [Chloroflexi bacterium]|nr:hypothetical protein [Chloroflexota bacterium]
MATRNIPLRAAGQPRLALERRLSAAGNSQSYRWRDLPEIRVPLHGEPLALDQTLACGQAFRWQRTRDGSWEGIAGHRIWRLRVADDALLARVAPPLESADVRAFLTHYFALDLSARTIQRQIAAAHPLAAQAVSRFSGLRILRQDPYETLITFAIATATNIPRVTRSIALLCQRHGSLIATVDESAYHDIPTPAAILAAPYADLFGPCNLAYRTRTLRAVAEHLASYSVTWIEHLRAVSYAEARRALDALPGLGPKVSDCICLFGLGHSDAVPVDRHIWAIAHELFGTEITTRTLTPRVYQRVGSLFRALFGPWAGWAQQYLFCARRAVPLCQRSHLGIRTYPASSDRSVPPP